MAMQILSHVTTHNGYFSGPPKIFTLHRDKLVSVPDELLEILRFAPLATALLISKVDRRRSSDEHGTSSEANYGIDQKAQIQKN